MNKGISTRKVDLCKADRLSTFWQKISSLPFETVHTRFCKGALGVHRKATNIAVMGELGRLPLSISVIKAMLKFWQHTTDQTYPNETLRSAISAGDGPWFDCLKNIYDIFGWHWHGSAPTNKDIVTMMTVLIQSYKDYWHNSVHIKGGSKLSIFKSSNKQFVTEPYLYTIKCKKLRGSLAQIRLSAHPLEIERGRYARPPLPPEERVCTYCAKRGTKPIGDEKHFLLECPLYDKERADMVHNVNISCPNFTIMNIENRFLYMLTCEGNAALHVARYISIAFDKKKFIMEPDISITHTLTTAAIQLFYYI